MPSEAVISQCGKYRYELSRHWYGGVGSIAWVMLNPSTADDTQDDPTIRRVVGFSKLWGYCSCTVYNLFAYRATDPKDLEKVTDPHGPSNDGYLKRLANFPKVIAAWGASPMSSIGVSRNNNHFRGVNLFHLGLTQRGFPRHPLYLPSHAKPEPFSVVCDVTQKDA